jgi:hypothetical protein
MEHDALLPYAQVLATFPYPDPPKSSLRLSILFL